MEGTLRSLIFRQEDTGSGIIEKLQKSGFQLSNKSAFYKNAGLVQ
jgi:hypothetical protein